MEEKKIEVNDIKIITNVPKGYIEDNNLKVFLDDTIDLEEVVSEVNSINVNNNNTNEININE